MQQKQAPEHNPAAQLTKHGPWLLAYALLCALVGDWLIDDAGISLAYARNLASGVGLVSQAGRPPVEGFSNFLWVWLLHPLHWLGLLDTLWAPKLLGAGLVMAAMVGLQRLLVPTLSRGWLWVPVVASAPLVLWSQSGLENGLYLALAVGLAHALVALQAGGASGWLAAAAWSAALCATRPDGVVYLVAAAVVVAVAGYSQRRAARHGARLAADALDGPRRWLLASVALLGGFWAFRLSYFGRFWPHTWYAKRSTPGLGARLQELASQPEQVLERLTEVLAGVGHAGLGWALLGAVHADVWWRWKHGERPYPQVVVLWLLWAGLGAFVVLDADWMPELRFATTPLTLLLALSATALDRQRTALQQRSVHSDVPGWLPLASNGLVAALVLGSTVAAAVRLGNVAVRAPTPLGSVQQQAATFSAWRARLGLPTASVLSADVGGLLWSDDLHVFDLAGLCEPAVVQTLKNGSHIWLDHHPAFYDWLFVEAKPTFIHTRAFWTHVPALQADPRFARDYVAVDAFDDWYVQQVFGAVRHGGDFVRRDALRSAQSLALLQATQPEPASGPPAWLRLRLWWLERREGPQSGRALRDRAIALLDNTAALPEVLGWLQLAHERSPDDPEVRWSLAWALDNQGRAQDARPLWQALLQQAEAAGDTVRAGAVRTRLQGPVGLTVSAHQLLPAQRSKAVAQADL